MLTIKKIFKSDFFFYLLIGLIILFNFIDSNILITHAKMSRFFDSDVLYLHRLYMDIVFDHHHLLNWNLTPAPYCFPDMLVFFILEVIMAHHVYPIVITFAIFQYLGLIFLAQAIASILLQSNQAKLFIYFVLLGSLIFLVIPGDNTYRLAIEAVYHFGGFINGLLLIYCLLLFFYKAPSEGWGIFSVGAISLLASLSDALFIPQFGLPVMFLLMMTRLRLIFSKLFFILMLGMSFGLLIKYFFLAHVDVNYFHFEPMQFLFQIKKIYMTVFLKFVKEHRWLGSACLAFYVLTFTQLSCAFFIQRKNFPSLGNLPIVNALRLYILISILTTFFFLAFFNVAFQRYMLNFYFYPLVFCWLPFASILSNAITRIIQVMLFSFVTLMAIYLSYKNFKSFRWEYYPPLIQCIDTNIYRYNEMYHDEVSYGIANNSQAGAITALSKTGLQAVELLNQLQPHRWINNPERYRSHYDFAVIALPGDAILTAPENILDGRLIEKINGKPIIVFQCNNEAIVWVYGKNKLILPVNV